MKQWLLMTEFLVEGYYLHFGLPYCLHYTSDNSRKIMVNYKVTGDSELNFKTILFTSNRIALFLGGKWNFPYIALFSSTVKFFFSP